MKLPISMFFQSSSKNGFPPLTIKLALNRFIILSSFSLLAVSFSWKNKKKKHYSIRCEKDSQFLPFWLEHWCYKLNFSTQFENIPTYIKICIKKKQKIKIISSNHFYNHPRVCIVIITLLSLLLLLSEM